MPIEIKELIIRATVDDSEKTNTESSSSLTKNDDTQDEIIAACVEQVLHILERAKER